jgi:predicted CXXCH cytochrome family protein
VVLAPRSAPAQVMVTSPTNKHNLSTSGPGPVKSTTMTEICVFCHTPHNSSPAAPLWNQTMSGATYIPYTSTTMVATAGVPSGSSKLCMSCHDGTVAIGSTINRGQIVMQGLTGGKLTGPSSLGTSLSDDHPISFVPVTGTPIVNPGPASPVKLDLNGQIQCRTCHDPHQMDIDPIAKKFLVASNSSSALCITCHRQTVLGGEPEHAHDVDQGVSSRRGRTRGTTVATNGCELPQTAHRARWRRAGSRPRRS